MTGFPPEVRELVRRRASDWYGAITCEVMARCTGRAAPVWDLHHRRARGAGGSKRPETNQPANALAVCRDCHSYIETQRQTALANGWLVRQTRDPTDIPVLRRGHWVYLNDLGGIVPASVPCQCGLYESEHLSVNCPCTTYEPNAEAA